MKKFKIFIAITIFFVAAIAFSHLFAVPGLSMAIALPLVPGAKQVDLDTIQKKILASMNAENPGALAFYTGQNNHALSFSGGTASSFLDEPSNTAEFGIRIVNATPTMKMIVLCPAYFSTLGTVTAGVVSNALVTEDVTVTVGGVPRVITVITSSTPTTANVVVGLMFHDITSINANHGVSVDGVVDDDIVCVDGGKNVTVSSLSKGKVVDFLAFVKKNPTRVIEMTIASNNVSQYGRKITLKSMNPAGDWGEEYIQLTKYFETSQYRTEKIVVDTDAYNLQFDDQSLVIFEVEAAVSTTVPTQTDITMRLGATINDANEVRGLAITGKKVIKIAATGLAGN